MNHADAQRSGATNFDYVIVSLNVDTTWGYSRDSEFLPVSLAQGHRF
jgi:hypothetical protein